MKEDRGLYSIQVKYIMEDNLQILWCLNTWDGLPETLEGEILHAISEIQRRRTDVGIRLDFPILMDFARTAMLTMHMKTEDFKFESIHVEDSMKVPGKHIIIPVMKRTPVVYHGERNPL